jgi:hypothetical protein
MKNNAQGTGTKKKQQTRREYMHKGGNTDRK